MLPVNSDDRTLTHMLKATTGALGAVFHYAACSLAITIGPFVVVSSIVWILVGQAIPAENWWPVYWIAVLGILLVELLFRPPLRLTAGLGVLSLLGLCSWIALLVLVHIAL